MSSAVLINCPMSSSGTAPADAPDSSAKTRQLLPSNERHRHETLHRKPVLRCVYSQRLMLIDPLRGSLGFPYFLPLPGDFFAGFFAGALLGFFGGALVGFFSGTLTGNTEQ